MEAFGRFDNYMRRAAAMALYIAGAVMLFWAALIFGTQCLAWLKFGMWQSVPAFAVMLSSSAQSFALVPLGLLDASFSPLAMVPSMGSFETPDEVSSAIGGNLLGITKIASELISWPFSLWIALFGWLFTSAAESLLND